MTTPFNLEAAIAAATERLRRSLNRGVGQHRMHLARRVDELLRRRGVTRSAP